jgi:hypothetical protein
MVFSTIEWFALVLAVLTIVKLLVISINAKSWMSFSKSLFVKPWLATTVSLVLALVVLYYLLAELTIVQIFATMLFLSLLMTASLAHFYKDLHKTVNKNIKGKIKDMWLSIIIWMILSVWVLFSLFT